VHKHIHDRVGYIFMIEWATNVTLLPLWIRLMW